MVQPLDRGFLYPALKLAVLAESDLTGRRRAHRRPRPRARYAETFFDDITAGDYVVHHQHGVGRFGGMVRRSIGGVERDYLLLEYRGGDKLYVPSDQVDLLRPYTGGEIPKSAPAQRHRLAAGQVPGPIRSARDRPGARRAVPEADHAQPATPSPPTPRGSARWRRRSPTPRRPTS